MYAGGSQDFLSANYHEFYGLQKSDAFGNEVITARVQNEFKIWDIYHSSELSPLYSKEIHLLAGMDYLKTERIFIDEQFIRDGSAKSFHAGLKLESTLFYLVPVDFVFLLTHVEGSRGKNEQSSLLLIKGNLFP